MRLIGKTAIVTGAAMGLGRAVALGFAREGANVVAADIDESNGRLVVEDINAKGGQAVFVRTDVSVEEDAPRLSEKAMQRFGHIDILFNNAAVLLESQEAPVHELDVDIWDKTMAINLRGYFLCSKFAIPPMLAQGAGSVIHVGSPCGFVGIPPVTAYSASKGGTIGLTRVMAASYARNKIRVNCIIPGTMDTRMSAGDAALHAKYCEDIPIGRLGAPEDIVGLSVFLASDESAYCTGGFYACDGGLTAA